MAQTIAAIYRNSRGVPRLINTICENALINSFARQARIVMPEIIDEVATDFRLNVTHPSVEESTKAAQNEGALQAVKTLLQLQEYLQSAKGHENESAVPVAPRLRKHEPYI